MSLQVINILAFAEEKVMGFYTLTLTKSGMKVATALPWLQNTDTVVTSVLLMAARATITDLQFENAVTQALDVLTAYQMKRDLEDRSD